MSKQARPVEGDSTDQDAQHEHLVDTGNGPTVTNETTLLEAEFGPADMAGVYREVSGGDLA